MYRLVFHNVTEGDWHGIRFVDFLGGRAESFDDAKLLYLPEADYLFRHSGVSMGGSRLLVCDETGFREVVKAHVGLEMRDTIACLIKEGHIAVLKVFADDSSFQADEVATQ